MSSNLTKIAKACKAMEPFGITEEKVKAELKHLLKLYDDQWSIIEEDNFRVLLEYFLEGTEEENKNLKSMRQDASLEDESREIEIPLKRRSRNRKDYASSSIEVALEIKGQAQPSPNKKVRTTYSWSSRDKGKEEMFPETDSTSKGCDIKKESGIIIQDNILDFYENRYCVALSGPKTHNQVNGFNALKDPQSSNSTTIEGVQKNEIVKYPNYVEDISRGEESVPISLLNDNGAAELPKFRYIPKNIVYKNAYVNFSLARISDDNCCAQCFGDCLLSTIPCACATETCGEFAYTPDGLVKESFLDECIAMGRTPKKHHYYYCKTCPLEKNKRNTRRNCCKGHLLRKFIKECWSRCGCNRKCGNRVIQRGIQQKLQVFIAPEGKGWGLRSVQPLKKGTFVCEYVGEIVTNQELYEQNGERARNEKHTYPVKLDGDWVSRCILKDEEALCLDATEFGNVARFINHRCYDANLIEIPVEVETPDHHYYHIAFFTTREIKELEELTWDYGIQFDDENHPIKAFRCKCESLFCRDKNRFIV